jgi:hypothetical protein
MSENTISRYESDTRSFFASGMAIIWAIALAKLVFHIYFNNRYGYFRDELGYMACGDRLQWGYVDQPPMVPFLVHLSRSLLGDSLRSIRFFPALASSFLIVQTAVLARELGGRRYALILSAVCALVAPQYLSNASLLGTNCLEPTFWMGCAYFVILAIKRDNPRYWLWFGVCAGLGLENKYSIAVFGLGIVIGLLLTDHRRFLLGKWNWAKWIWIGGGVTFLIFLPNLLWNIHNHWPFAELMRNIRADGRDVVLGPFDYFFQQALLVNPLTAPIWLIGLFALLFSARLKPYRVLGWCYLVCYAFFFLAHGKSYYQAPVYPMLLAAGSVIIEVLLAPGLETREKETREKETREREITPKGQYSLTQNVSPVNKQGERASSKGTAPLLGRILKRAIVITLLVNGAYLIPITVPVLSPEEFLAYAKKLPMKLPVMEHAHARAVLPQWYADQFGWKEIADETAIAWNQLPAEERGSDRNKACGIFAQDYGQAGAIDFFGPKLGLPPALSGDRTYWLWGPQEYSGNCLIVLGDRRERLQELFGEVDFVGLSPDNEWALETGISVNICRKPKFGTLADLWPQLKHWR